MQVSATLSCSHHEALATLVTWGERDQCLSDNRLLLCIVMALHKHKRRDCKTQTCKRKAIQSVTQDGRSEEVHVSTDQPFRRSRRFHWSLQPYMYPQVSWMPGVLQPLHALRMVALGELRLCLCVRAGLHSNRP